ncbi:hypothetical protein PPL_04772 [Heterostelium album PN500]|uniref:Leucine-rich repeat-containing protein n=1 Tax=Heterostelium pallidum (strain ATCC 26659 / Pp 5 / PN500) TaxID=670386 RepID=D3B8H9_HETP5|nr:hypothetical protein PPL_04772 [Heterostelium album PN500]EFA82347.1 hypothetical protein PPL_04772 [Heterostelium album PN500]|eukprot:XP_020434464.1 hypothetical protein PPL_04772 [Heterostelium album PN500]
MKPTTTSPSSSPPLTKFNKNLESCNHKQHPKDQVLTTPKYILLFDHMMSISSGNNSGNYTSSSLSTPYNYHVTELHHERTTENYSPFTFNSNSEYQLHLKQQQQQQLYQKQLQQQQQQQLQQQYYQLQQLQQQQQQLQQQSQSPSHPLKRQPSLPIFTSSSSSSASSSASSSFSTSSKTPTRNIPIQLQQQSLSSQPVSSSASSSSSAKNSNSKRSSSTTTTPKSKLTHSKSVCSLSNTANNTPIHLNSNIYSTSMSAPPFIPTTNQAPLQSSSSAPSSRQKIRKAPSFSGYPNHNSSETTKVFDYKFIMEQSNAKEPCNVVALELPNSKIQKVNSNRFELFDKLNYLDLNNNIVQFNSLSIFPNLNELYLSNNFIQNLDHNGFFNLTKLDLSHNLIDSNHVSGLMKIPKLVCLNLSFNNIKTLPESLAEFVSLETLNLEYNHLGQKNTMESLSTIPNQIIMLLKQHQQQQQLKQQQQQQQQMMNTFTYPPKDKKKQPTSPTPMFNSNSSNNNSHLSLSTGKISSSTSYASLQQHLPYTVDSNNNGNNNNSSYYYHSPKLNASEPIFYRHQYHSDSEFGYEPFTPYKPPNPQQQQQQQQQQQPNTSFEQPIFYLNQQQQHTDIGDNDSHYNDIVSNHIEHNILNNTTIITPTKNNQTNNNNNNNLSNELNNSSNYNNSIDEFVQTSLSQLQLNQQSQQEEEQDITQLGLYNQDLEEEDFINEQEEMEFYKNVAEPSYFKNNVTNELILHINNN